MSILEKLFGKSSRRRIVSQEQIRLDFAQGASSGGGSLAGIVRNARAAMADPLSRPDLVESALDRDRQRKQLESLQGSHLDRLVAVPEDPALAFFRSVEISNPVRIGGDSGSAERIFKNVRSRARLGDEFGEAFYFSIGASKAPAAECLYIDQPSGGSVCGLLVCKLADGDYFIYTTVGEMKKTLKLA